MGSYEFGFFEPNLTVRGDFRLPYDFFPNCEVTPLLLCEVLLDQFAVRAAKIVDGVGHVTADVDFAVWIGDPVDDFH